MSLTPGQKLAHYLVDRKIGEGGMGEVYAATDTRLNRPAAIKALPAALAAEPERLARFKREAQLLAALSHPNIAGIYGLEQVDDALYLALELVEGDDLLNRIEGRKLPHDEAVEIALQIAAALEEAHEKGIIHRDLKPANIKIDADGRIKVLDFGLAKALSNDPDASNDSISLATSPTLTAVMGTQVGSILGTAGYMAPEQARGKKVDRRADIWAFGVVLFEMLTGEQMFTGDTVTDVIAQVVTREPEWEKLPAGTPPTVRRVLRRCLHKDPRKRLRDIGDAALELRGEFEDESAAGSSTDPAAMRSSRRSAWTIGAVGLLLGLILATVISIGLRDSAVETGPTWTNLAPPTGVEIQFGLILELSPDGRKVVFVAESPDGKESMLWVRDLGDDQARMLEGTENANQPFWSPDSQSIGYFARRKLRRISAAGGPSTELDDTGDSPRGGHWADDDTILYGPDWSQPLYRIPAAGGTATKITELSEERLELSHRWPHMLPDGKHFLFYAVSTYPALNPQNPSEVDKSGLYIGSLDGDEPKLLQTIPSRAVYVDGSLLFVDDNVLTARAFDVASLSFTGEPVALAEGVTQSAGSLWGGALFSVSDTGTLMFVRGARETRVLSQLKWFDRDGNGLESIGDEQPYNDIYLSHDDNRVTTSIGDPGDIWILDFARDTSTRFTFDSGNDFSAVWSQDGDQVVFTSSRLITGRRFTPANLFRKTASGLEEEELLPLAEDVNINFEPSDWSPDGAHVVLTGFTPRTGADILLYSLESGELSEYLKTPGDEDSPTFSPDGRWLAYGSNETGDYEVYVAAYPGPGGKWQVSRDGGQHPRWRADGRELFYAAEDDLMAVPVETDGVFQHGTPVKLFTAPPLLRSESLHTWDVSSDGQRFLVLAPGEGTAVEVGVVSLVQGWRELLE